MELLKTILSKTCVFIIKTSFRNSLIAQEWGSGQSGHLMRLSKPADDKFNDYYKFIIYPDPETENTYRMIVSGWPDLHVQLENDRARVVKYEDTDFQKFKFQMALPPKIEIDPNKEWNYLLGLGVDKIFDFASHDYVFPSNNNADDRTKLRFLPIDIIKPDASKLLKPINYVVSDLAPPQNYKPTNGKEYGLKRISVEAIPAALITDDNYRNKIDQIAMSPYYYLKHEKLWSAEQLPVVTLSKNQKTKIDKEFTTAFKSSDYKSVEKTVGHTFSAAIELYGKLTGEVKAGDQEVSASGKREVGASLKLAYQYQNQTKTISQQTNSSEKTIREKIEREYRQLDKDEGDIFLYHWLPIDRFTLTNSSGVVKGNWDYISSDNPIPQEIQR